MAGSVNFRSDFSRGMDCHICKGRLDDPKVLSCKHTFCKSCLDKMIRFRADGSGIIICPMRCWNTTTTDATAITTITKTRILADQTTNDLPVPEELKDTLDAFNKQSIKHKNSLKKLDCVGQHGCADEATVYCLVCKILLCPTCMQSHDDTHANLSVQYNRQAEQITLLCGKHRTMANYFCSDCDKIICVYCKNREHVLHQGVDTLKEQANKVRDVLFHPEYGVGNIDDIIVNSVKNTEATELSISILRSMLQKTLRNRKLKGLREYLSLALKEEKRILNEFDDTVSQQLQRYPKPVSTNICGNILEKEDFEIVLSKREIDRNVAAFTKTIPVLKLGLLDSTTMQPLGDLNVERNAFVTISNRRTCASVSQSWTGFKQVPTGSENLERLRCLLNDVMQTTEGICGTQKQQEVQDNKPPVIYSQESSMNTILQSNLQNLPQLDKTPSCAGEEKLESTVSTEKPSVDPATSNSLKAVVSMTPSCDGEEKLESTVSTDKPSVDPASSNSLKAVVSTEKNPITNAESVSTTSFIDIEKLESIMSVLNKGRGIDCIRDLCKDNNEEVILSILGLHPSVASLKNTMGNSLFHFASSFGCARVLFWLLSMDLNTIDTPNSLGSTPLHYATENCHAECVELLLSSNCRTDLENCSGYTALALARKLHNAEIIALFEKYVTN